MNLIVQYSFQNSDRLGCGRHAIYCRLAIPYLHEKGPMGGAPYIGPRLGDGPIFEVSVSQIHNIDAKERPGKLTMDFHNSNSSRGCY